MVRDSRREFLKNVGTGAIVASVGPSLAADLGFDAAFAAEGGARLTFGRLEPLVSLMQETAAARLVPLVVDRLKNGTPLADIVSALALSNARTFGGEDYIGFHTMMAIAPAFHMSAELPEAKRALPVLKVLYRNASRIQDFGGPEKEVLKPVTGQAPPAGQAAGGEVLRQQIRTANQKAETPEQTFAGLARTPEEALNNVLYAVQDAAEVHRVVLPYRAWDLMGIIGREQAHTLLRQSVRFCVKSESERYAGYFSSVRTVIPRLLDQHRLVGRTLGNRRPEDRWIEEMSQTIFRSTPEQAADAVVAALVEGIDPIAIAEATSLAANLLVLRDNGRPKPEGPNKPAGSVHGDSVGVHGCDAANAWRNLARVANDRNKVVCLMLGAWQVARDRGFRSDFLTNEPYPRPDAREQVRTVERILPALDDAIRNRDQARAAALAARYGETGQPMRPLWDLLLGYAISEDGALHAEKFYRTVTEEFGATRPAFRWRQLIALARVTASQYGYAAPGHEDACKLLGV